MALENVRSLPSHPGDQTGDKTAQVAATASNNLRLQLEMHSPVVSDGVRSYGTYAVKDGDNLWRIAKNLLVQEGLESSKKDIATLIKVMASENHVLNANKINTSMHLSYSLPHIRIDTHTDASHEVLSPAKKDDEPGTLIADSQKAKFKVPTPDEWLAQGTVDAPAGRSDTGASRPGNDSRNGATKGDQPPTTTHPSPGEQTGPIEPEKPLENKTPEAQKPAPDADPFEKYIPGRTELNRANQIMDDKNLTPIQKYEQATPYFQAALQGAASLDQPALKEKLESDTKTLNAINTDKSKAPDPKVQQQLSLEIAVLSQGRVEPLNVALAFATGLSQIAHELKTSAASPAASANNDDVAHLRAAAVGLLQQVGKNDPTYGGSTTGETALYKKVLNDGIASVQKGEPIDAARSQSEFNLSATQIAVKEGIAGAGNDLHNAIAGNIPLIGTVPALTPSIFGLRLWESAASKIPFIGDLMKSGLFSADRTDEGLTAEFAAAKKADSPAAKSAIDDHKSELKDQVASGLSTFAAGPGGLIAAESTLKGLASVGLKAPNPYVKLVSLGVLALTEGVLINETAQATSHAAFGTKMDSQGKILSETAASVGSFALLRNLASPGAAPEAIKFGGLMSTGAKQIGLRFAVGAAPGVAFGVATQGPWSINPKTNKPYTALDTIFATATDGVVTGGLAAFTPMLAQFGTNTAVKAWSVRSMIGTAAASNALYEAGTINPTQINPQTGERYTVAETASAAGHNLLNGAVGGYTVGVFLPKAINSSTWLPRKLGSLLHYATDETAGKVDASVAQQAGKEAPGRVARAIRPIGDGLNAARSYLGHQRTIATDAIAGSDSIIKKHVIPQIETLKKPTLEILRKVPPVAAQATSAFALPGTELYHWNKDDKNSDLAGQ